MQRIGKTNVPLAATASFSVTNALLRRSLLLSLPATDLDVVTSFIHWCQVKEQPASMCTVKGAIGEGNHACCWTISTCARIHWAQQRQSGDMLQKWHYKMTSCKPLLTAHTQSLEIPSRQLQI